MKLRTPLIRAALAATMVATAFAIERVPAADAAAHDTGARDALAMHVDAAAPVPATLMPELRVGTRASDVSLDARDALPVTLLPTVHVTASARDFAGLPSFGAFDDDVALLASAD